METDNRFSLRPERRVTGKKRILYPLGSLFINAFPGDDALPGPCSRQRLVRCIGQTPVEQLLEKALETVGNKGQTTGQVSTTNGQRCGNCGKRPFRVVANPFQKKVDNGSQLHITACGDRHHVPAVVICPDIMGRRLFKDEVYIDTT